MWVYRVWDGLWATLPVVLVVLAFRPVSARAVCQFTDRYGLPVTPETKPVVIRSIRRGRTGRLVMAAIGLSLHPVLYAIGLKIPSQVAFYGLAGYLLGAFVTSLVVESPGVEPRQASLVPRRPSDYLPRTALIAPVSAVAVAALAVLAYEVEPRQAVPSGSASLGGLALAAVATAAMFIAVRVVVARSQPLTTPGLVAVNDAVRTQAVHTLAAAGISLALLGTTACLFEMGVGASSGWLHVTGQIAGSCTLAGAVVAWTFSGAAWRVPRTMLR